jgi:hypothetical protein
MPASPPASNDIRIPTAKHLKKAQHGFYVGDRRG